MSDRISRLRFLRRIRRHPAATVVVVIWTILSGLSILPILLPPDKAQRFSLYPYLPKWDWHIVVVGFVVIFAITVSESYYNFYRSKNAEVEKINSDLKEQALTAQQNTKAYMAASFENIQLKDRLRVAEGELEPKKRELQDAYKRITSLSEELSKCREDKMPRPYLEVEDSVVGEAWGKTAFKFTNRGGEVAHNVQVQPLVIDHHTVVFDPISIIYVNDTRSTLPNIPGGIRPLHDILNLMQKEWEEAWNQRRLASQEEIDEWETKLLITYEDFAGKRFEATADLVVFPLKRNERNRRALESPPPRLNTAEVRHIKFREMQ